MLEFKDEPVKSAQSSIASSFEATDKLTHANGDVTVENSVDTVKSAISVVQEIAQKRDLPIRFVVESETGPAHMKHFVMKCSVGEIEVSSTLLLLLFITEKVYIKMLFGFYTDNW